MDLMRRDMAKREKYKRLEQLYVVGKEAVFEDGTVMWVQVMNPLQLDECRMDAQTAKARMVMALKEVGSDEQTKALVAFEGLTTEVAIEQIVNLRWQSWFEKANNRLRDDPEWQERAQIMDRTDSVEMERRAPDDPERVLYEAVSTEFVEQLQKAIDDEVAYERDRLKGVGRDELCDEYMEIYQQRRADAAANLEYAMTEAWYAARVCEGIESEPGVWDHSKCNSHIEQVWDTKDEYRATPAPIQQIIRTALDDLSMTVRDAKNSDSTTSSSASSVLPSELEESTLSTPEGVLVSAPGPST